MSEDRRKHYEIGGDVALFRQMVKTAYEHIADGRLVYNIDYGHGQLEWHWGGSFLADDLPLIVVTPEMVGSAITTEMAMFDLIKLKQLEDECDHIEASWRAMTDRVRAFVVKLKKANEDDTARRGDGEAVGEDR